LFLSDGYEITQMPQFHEEHYTPGVCMSTNKVLPKTSRLR